MQRTWQESHLQEQTNTLKQQPQWHYYCEKEIVLDEDCHLYTTAAPTNNKKPSQKHLKKGRRNFPRGSTPRCKMRKKWFIWKATATRPPLWGPTRVKKSVLSQCNTPDRKGNCNNKQPLWNTNFTATAAETFLDNNWHIYIFFFCYYWSADKPAPWTSGSLLSCCTNRLRPRCFTQTSCNSSNEHSKHLWLPRFDCDGHPRSPKDAWLR